MDLPVLARGGEDLRHVLLVHLSGVVVLEAVERVGMPLGDALPLICYRLGGGLGVVAWRHEAGGGRPERPDADGVLRYAHAGAFSLWSLTGTNVTGGPRYSARTIPPSTRIACPVT